MTIDLPDLATTEHVGRALGEVLTANSVIALIGPLGAGKTHFTRAIAAGLEVCDLRLVTSPTFVLIQEYPARLTLYHFDAYRLSGADAFRDLGAEEYFTLDGVCIIEWADRVEEVLPADRLTVMFTATGPTQRQLTVSGNDALMERWQERLR